MGFEKDSIEELSFDCVRGHAVLTPKMRAMAGRQYSNSLFKQMMGI
jgi:hypothetical protein